MHNAGTLFLYIWRAWALKKRIVGILTQCVADAMEQSCCVDRGDATSLYILVNIGRVVDGLYPAQRLHT